ncbi:hypothetical protein ACTXT7_015206 [Hymenolepis weldensis]
MALAPLVLHKRRLSLLASSSFCLFSTRLPLPSISCSHVTQPGTGHPRQPTGPSVLAWPYKLSGRPAIYVPEWMRVGFLGQGWECARSLKH